jgi:oligosaccharide repeat unit polymerase
VKPIHVLHTPAGFARSLEPVSAIGDGIPSGRGGRFRSLHIRSAQKLPFFCHPIKLFCFVWVVMLAALSVHVSESSYPTLGTPLLLFFVSLTSLGVGYFLVRLFVSAHEPAVPGGFEDRELDCVKLRILNTVFLIISLVIVFLNLKLAGLPPAFSFLSINTKEYLEYGKLKQVLFPLLVAILVNSSLDPLYRFKIFFGGFASVVMVLYLTRLNLMFAVFQIIALFALTSQVKTKKIYLVAFITLVCAILAANVLGNNRTSRDVFMEFLQIKASYSDAPMPFLWAVSYFSIPISDMSWIVQEFHRQDMHLSSLYPLLPAFWTPDNPYQTFLESDARIIDGAHTYLANYFMDASFAGVAFINVLIGMASGLFMAGRALKSPLVFAVLLGAIVFLFFSDLFTPLSTLILVFVQHITESYTISPRLNRIELQEALA